MDWVYAFYFISHSKTPKDNPLQHWQSIGYCFHIPLSILNINYSELMITWEYQGIFVGFRVLGSRYLIDTEKAMAPHSSTLAWKIPWTEEPGGLQSMGSQRVGHDWATSLSLVTFLHWRRKWQPTPVFLPGESQGRGSLVGCRLWGRTESDTTDAT